MEHYVTLFDGAFLPQGLALLASLRRQACPFTLWVLAMDEVAERLMPQAGPEVRVIPLREAETPAHLARKDGRTKGEWCWTMTPTCFRSVFYRDPSVQRVTYLDADLFLLAPPAPIFVEFEHSGKHVLITEHRFDPMYDRSHDCGRFCVQFLTVRRSEEAFAVIDWWQERCIEWCFDRREPDRFGDQKYLDRWPVLFPSAVHVLELPRAFTAPWNHRHHGGSAGAAFHHFHGFRRVGKGRYLWWFRYRMGTGAADLYAAYQQEVEAGVRWLLAHGGRPVSFPTAGAGGLLARCKALLRLVDGSLRYGSRSNDG